MPMITVECAATEGRHDRRRVDFGYYRRYRHKWYDTIGLTCRICGGLMVADHEGVRRELGEDALEFL